MVCGFFFETSQYVELALASDFCLLLFFGHSLHIFLALGISPLLKGFYVSCQLHLTPRFISAW